MTPQAAHEHTMTAEASVSAAAGPIAAVMVHVTDVAQALAWYQQAFPAARPRRVHEMGFDCLVLDGVQIDVVPADAQVACGAAGSVVYWRVPQLDTALRHFQSLGAQLYRGPMRIEHGMAMCQVKDPWGNCIGLRGPQDDSLCKDLADGAH